MVIHTLDHRGLPPADLEARLASHLHGGPALYAEVLRALMGRPKSLPELVPTVRSARYGKMTAALKALKQEAVITQRIDASTTPPTQVYELTQLGKEVILLMERLRFAVEAKSIFCSE